MKGFYFQFGMLVMGGLALLLWGPWSHKLPRFDLPEMSSLVETVSGSSGPTVLVMVIPDVASIDALRAAIHPERIIASSEQAFAMVDGRVFASSISAATGPINLAGWADRPIELVEGPGQHRPTVSQQQAQEAARLLEEVAQGDAFKELKNKDSLSHGESMRLLKQMERHGGL